ncbi:hypothetical protein D4S03_02620 [bacterium]|nr:MAG: hypothetical protein D4S03_02620 [bacterium]
MNIDPVAFRLKNWVYLHESILALIMLPKNDIRTFMAGALAGMLPVISLYLFCILMVTLPKRYSHRFRLYEIACRLFASSQKGFVIAQALFY